MPEDAWIQAGRHLRIPRSEVSFRATRSSGPGGQHVNTSSTRVELRWNLETSTAPTDAQRLLMRERLASRVDSEGWLRLTESGSRSQFRNREVVTERLAHLLARAILPVKKRKPTRVPQRAKQKRLDQKRQRGKLKAMRGRVPHDE